MGDAMQRHLLSRISMQERSERVGLSCSLSGDLGDNCCCSVLHLHEHGCNPHKLPSEHPHSGRPSCWLQIPPTALKATHGNSPLGVCGISTAWRCLLSLCGLLQLIG